MKKAVIIIILVVLIDQISKFYVKLNMVIGEKIVVTDWFNILFVENNGMAYGLEFGGDIGKIFLSIFRIVFIAILIIMLFKGIAKKNSNYFIVPMSLIVGGAIGNLIDSLFYGIIFNDSFGQVATLFPSEGGYSSFLRGKVVDMLYFPLIETKIPEWFPSRPNIETTILPNFIYDNFPWANSDFVFFRFIFNGADSFITMGMILFILFYKKTFEKDNFIIKTI